VSKRKRKYTHFLRVRYSDGIKRPQLQGHVPMPRFTIMLNIATGCHNSYLRRQALLVSDKRAFTFLFKFVVRGLKIFFRKSSLYIATFGLTSHATFHCILRRRAGFHKKTYGLVEEFYYYVLTGNNLT
jgi:hypothetical protein